MHERDASVTAEYVKAEGLAKVLFTMSEKDPALRVSMAVADYFSFFRNLRLDFIKGKTKKAVEHLMSVIGPATLKALIESKLEMDKSDLKKDFLEFVAYLEKIAIVHDEHNHIYDDKKTSDTGTKNTYKNSAGGRSSGHNSGERSFGGGRNTALDCGRSKSGNERSSDPSSTGKQSTRELPPCHDTKKCAG
jgi:hypothetical protein